MQLKGTRLAFGASALIAAVLAGCGGSGSSSTTATSASTGASSPAGGTSVSTADNSDLGQTILVDGQGKTLYLFEKDTGTQSQCSGECANDWPPYTTNGKPTAGSGIDASKLGTTKRSDGSTQVTFDGHPLYHFEGDQSAGDINGNGTTAFGAEWYAVQPSGDTAEGNGGDESSSGSSSTDSSGTDDTSSSSGGAY
jgi:predicted lipoprotein with Yx(FWY)xxD motif